MDKLKYIEEHVTCLNYQSDRACTFKYHSLSSSEKLEWKCDLNSIVFVLSGHIKITLGIFSRCSFFKGDIILLPCIEDKAALEVKEDSVLITCSFDVPYNVCDKLIFTNCVLPPERKYDFSPVHINEVMWIFLDLLSSCLQERINCKHFHAIMEKEMFFLFKYFYNKEELAALFHPLCGESFTFKKSVLENYQKARGVHELAQLLNMSRSMFDTKFKQEFSMPPATWMRMQLASRLRYAAAEPGVSVSQLIELSNFHTPSAFSRFVREQFGCSPTELIQRKGIV